MNAGKQSTSLLEAWLSKVEREQGREAREREERRLREVTSRDEHG